MPAPAATATTPSRVPAGANACCAPGVVPDIGRGEAASLACIAKALGDPIRLQLLDVLRRHGGEVCVCELTPLFDVGQPTVSHHLKVLRTAGLIEADRRGVWAYYRVVPDALAPLTGWLDGPRDTPSDGGAR
jgi:ArsR family transcriptional regulator, arsenate/arsenite/antimonite-responsive transcriptional repressor